MKLLDTITNVNFLFSFPENLNDDYSEAYQIYKFYLKKEILRHFLKCLLLSWKCLCVKRFLEFECLSSPLHLRGKSIS